MARRRTDFAKCGVHPLDAVSGVDPSSVQPGVATVEAGVLRTPRSYCGLGAMHAQSYAARGLTRGQTEKEIVRCLVGPRGAQQQPGAAH
jgi:hypothetical protein